MLQVFYLDVAKVNRHVAYVAMAIHVCFKCMFQMFHLFFQRSLQVFHLDVAYVSHVCCKCFNFYLDVAYVCNGFQEFQVFVSVLDAYCKCFNCFIHMLQVFRPNVLKVYWNIAHVAM